MARGPDGEGFKPGHRATPSLYVSTTTAAIAVSEPGVFPESEKDGGKAEENAEKEVALETVTVELQEHGDSSDNKLVEPDVAAPAPA